MITDNALYTLAVLLGSIAMLLIVFYHFLEINATIDPEDAKAQDGQHGGNAKATPLSAERKADSIPAGKVAAEKLWR